ncbi:hypothetical protein LEM8419_03454 [Neolewinella maritima]|uniref:Uncharacterized protein n=1 Tax=Neolewinella maritima TaxID=1383882 RepID=A0ABN8FDX3_9BACT|nr:hypothetical protein LEM8419_03454 [Neolewinella maritima]
MADCNWKKLTRALFQTCETNFLLVCLILI